MKRVSIKLVAIGSTTLLVVLTGSGCTTGENLLDGKPSDGGDVDSDTDSDIDSDSDSDTDSDSDSDTGSNTDNDTDSDIERSYIWIANSIEGTLSKVHTQLGVEVARFETGPNQLNDPSSTSVNLYGDVVVTNRSPWLNEFTYTPSAVVKFAAYIEDCIDSNDNDTIETSSGPAEVLPWGQDECMLWSTDLPGAPMGGHGARATAWDGQEDPDTGLGGHVWVGTCSDYVSPQMVYKLNGDTGEIEAEVALPGTIWCASGGAVDGDGGLWVIDIYAMLARIDMETLETTTSAVDCGYGITVDTQGRSWAGNSACLTRYDPGSETADTITVVGAEQLCGIAVGVEKSIGFVWASDTSGTLFKIDEDSMEVADSWPMGSGYMLGAAVDFEGYVWTVSAEGNAAYKFDPDTSTHITVPVGEGPGTYSDMTGVQLRNVIFAE